MNDLRNKSVLVIDDDAGMLRALTRTLTGEGLVVASTSDPLLAIEYLVSGNWRFDVIITDLRMPGLDGTEVLEIVKTSRPNIPVIIITAYGTGEAQVVAAQLGAAAYLEKPVATNELLAAIRRAVLAPAFFVGVILLTIAGICGIPEAFHKSTHRLATAQG